METVGNYSDLVSVSSPAKGLTPDNNSNVKRSGSRWLSPPFPRFLDYVPANNMFHDFD